MDKIEHRAAVKWVEHDREIYRLKSTWMQSMQDHPGGNEYAPPSGILRVFGATTLGDGDPTRQQEWSYPGEKGKAYLIRGEGPA